MLHERIALLECCKTAETDRSEAAKKNLNKRTFRTALKARFVVHLKACVWCVCEWKAEISMQVGL